MSGILQSLSAYKTTVAGGGGTFPPGLTVWARYKASDMIAVGNGNSLSQWDDKSGNGRHATQSTSARRPLLRTAASGLVGNTAAVEFLGTDSDPHYLIVPDMTALTSGFIATFHIADTDTTGSGNTANIRRLWEMGTGESTSGRDGYYIYTNLPTTTGIYETFGTNSRKTTGTPTGGTITSWHSYMVASASGAFTTYINNTQFFTTATNTVGFHATPQIGGYLLGGSGIRLSKKKMAEIVICSAVPNSTDRGLLQTYFTDEYT